MRRETIKYIKATRNFFFFGKHLDTSIEEERMNKEREDNISSGFWFIGLDCRLVHLQFEY